MDERRRRRLWRIAAVVLAIALVISGGWFAWEVLRPRTIREVIEADRWAPGAAVDVEGTITGITRVNTSDGPEAFLELDHYGFCGSSPDGGWDVRGDPGVVYRLGDRFRTTLHFAAYMFNGDPAVSAPELPCPFPDLPWALTLVWDVVSFVAGFRLVYLDVDANGWARYEVLTTSGDSYRPDVLPVTLRRSPPLLALDPELRARASINSAGAWLIVMAAQYVLLSGNYGGAPVVDDMAALTDGTSRNGTIRYADVNGNGLLDDRDRIDVRLPDPGGPTRYDTYMLQVGEVNGSMAAYAYAGHYLLNGPRGPLELLPDRGLGEFAHLRHLGDQIVSRVTSTLEVTDVRSGSPRPLSALEYRIAVNDTYPESRGNLTDLPTTLPSGVSLSFVDAGAAGVFDIRDRVVVGNLDNRTPVRFDVFDGGTITARAYWIAGYGHVIGRPSWPSLTATGSGPYRVDVSVPYWHPELNLTLTPRVTLQENSNPVLRDLPIVNGTVGMFANGSLAFADADGDGFLSEGDYFTVQGSPAARYDLEVSLIFGTVFDRVTFGP